MARTITARQLMDLSVPESQLLKDCLETLARFQYLAHHCYDSRYCGPDPGLPDIFASGHNRNIWIETKILRGKQAQMQRIWEQRIRQGGDEYYLWRPSDWSNGSIVNILKPDWMKDWTL